MIMRFSVISDTGIQLYVGVPVIYLTRSWTIRDMSIRRDTFGDLGI